MQYQTGAILGWINAALLVLLTAMFMFRKFYKKPDHVKKTVSKLHPLTAYLLILTTLTHSMLIWGQMKLHTGHLVFMAIIAALVLGKWGMKLKIKKWFPLHFSIAIPALAALVLHLVKPYLFGGF